MAKPMSETARKPIKHLYRSRKNRLVGGVCGGLAEYFGIDPTLVRLVWVALFIAWGSGLLIYLIAWLIIPSEPIDWGKTSVSEGSAPAPTSSSKPLAIIGIIIICIGLLGLLKELSPIFDFNFYFGMLSFPYWLIIIGIIVILISLIRSR